MRLSDALALGRTLTTLWSNVHSLKGRCALQAAGLAISGDGWQRWPGLPSKLELPCQCTGEVYGAGMMMGTIEMVKSGHWPHQIVHMFNHHVVHLKDWTFDQLIDWVRSVEPPEAEGENSCETPARTFTCPESTSTATTMVK